MKKEMTYSSKTYRLFLFCFASFSATALGFAEAPNIIFISENQTALVSAQAVVTAEYNAEQREALRETDLEAWAAYEAVEWRSVPVAYRDARLAEILTLLGLAEDDPADKGFTDLLESLGYEVYRTWSERVPDPITGAIDQDHEFWTEPGPEGEPARGLTQEQIERLSAADLIIMSPNISANRYSWSGGPALIQQWNQIPTPIVTMNALLATTNEWGSYAWGFAYGYTFTLHDLAPYDRRDETPANLVRFVFVDTRPQARRPDHPFLAGVDQLDDARVDLFKDEFPILPRTLRKFSNNPNYAFPSNVRVILELELPSFFAAGLDIPTRDPVLLEADAGVRYFAPTGGVPSERVGTPAARRVLFAAGVQTTGLYNLNPTGEQVLANIALNLAGPAGDGPSWAGLPIDAAGRVETPQFGGVWPNEAFAYIERLGVWVYLPEEHVVADGAWVFAHGLADLSAGGQGWVETEALGHVYAEDGYLYIADAGHWAYLPAEAATIVGEGRFLFVFEGP